MKNLGNFFALAVAQLDRVNGGKCQDAVLLRLRSDFHPTAPSRAATIGATAIPNARRLLYLAAVQWLAEPSGEELATTFYGDAAEMELRGQLIRDGAVTAAHDAPCRSWPWAPICDRLDRLSIRTTVRAYDAVMEQFRERSHAFLADARHLLQEPASGLFLPLSQDAIDGLAWVAGDEGAADWTEASAIEVAKLAVDEQAKHWPTRRLVPAWDHDAIARWAEVCHHYVEESRRVR